MFNYLPGVQIQTVDGGLLARAVPQSKSTLVIGTAGQGPAGNPFQVADRAAAAATFGFSGNLIKAMEEVATYSDNVILFRMGTSPLVLKGVGKTTADTASITNVAITTNVATITAANDFIVGQQVTITGLTNTFLNGTWTLTAATGTTFGFAITHANLTSAADAGTATVVGSGSTGFNITFGQVTSTSATDYMVWYKNGVLAVYYKGTIVYSNQTNAGVNTGDVSLSLSDISTQLGLQLGTGSTPSLANAITVTAAVALVASGRNTAVTKTDPVTGVGLTNRQLYIALAKAFDLLSIFQVDQVYAPDAVFGVPNVAYKLAAGDINDPATNPNALDWLKVTVAANGTKTYQWANDSTDDQGGVTTPMVAVTPAARIAAGFYEVHFPYLMANFCAAQDQELGGCIGFIGTSGPNSYSLLDTRNWVGFLPTYDPISGNPTAAGSGLLGTPTLAGTTASQLNSLCADFAQGFRKPGFFMTLEGQYDGTPMTDINQNLIDLGAYLHVFADHGIIGNGFATRYETNLAGVVAGYCASLDEASALTNKQLNVVQLWKPALSQMDALTQIGINVLRFKGLNLSPVMLHGETAASAVSDYSSLLRVRIKFLIESVLRAEADKFIGQSTIDGLQLSALKTALESRCVSLQKRGYISTASFNITSSPAEQRLGHARIDIKFSPADELVQLNAYVGIQR